MQTCCLITFPACYISWSLLGKKADFSQRKQSFSLKRKNEIFPTTFGCVQMNVSLWDVPCHLEDYNSLAAMELRAFQGLFQDTKLNQNDLTEKSVLPKYKIMENYQWWNKTCFMWTIHLPGHSFKIYFGRFWKRVYLPPSSRALSKFGGGKKQCEVQYIFSYPKLRWRFLHTQIYSITFLYNTMQWIPYSLIFPLFYSCHGSRINVSFPQHTHTQ